MLNGAGQNPRRAPLDADIFQTDKFVGFRHVLYGCVQNSPITWFQATLGRVRVWQLKNYHAILKKKIHPRRPRMSDVH